MRFNRKIRVIVRITLAAVAAIVLAGCIHSSLPLVTPAPHFKEDKNPDQNLLFQRETIRLISLNVAHGRKDCFSQIFTSDKRIRRNLLDIAWYFKLRAPDIVALQEADGPSRWSGNFDHVNFLARHGEFQFHARSEHVNAFFGNYGTAVLSRLPIRESQGFTFAPTPPTTNKGFTLTTVEWQASTGAKPNFVDVISLHLDFLSSRARRQQIKAIRDQLAGRRNPVIIMGDFNSEEIATEYLPELFEGVVKLQAFDLHRSHIGSYGDKRLDWVLLSPELEFVDYRVDDVVLSDHRPLILDVRFRQPSRF